MQTLSFLYGLAIMSDALKNYPNPKNEAGYSTLVVRITSRFHLRGPNLCEFCKESQASKF